MRREARASRYRVAAFAPRARECPPTVARVRPSLDPFQCGRPEIYSGIARSWPIYARVTTSETPLRGPRGSGARATWSLRLVPVSVDARPALKSARASAVALVDLRARRFISPIDRPVTYHEVSQEMDQVPERQREVFGYASERGFGTRQWRPHAKRLAGDE